MKLVCQVEVALPGNARVGQHVIPDPEPRRALHKGIQLSFSSALLQVLPLQGGTAGFNTGKEEKLSSRQPVILAATCLAVA